jgi:hypothetical protein
MKTLKLTVFLALALAVLASCTTFTASGLSYMLKTPKTTSLGEFRTEVWVHEFLGAAAGSKLFNISADATNAAVKDAIQKEITDRHGDAAINVSIEHQASFVDIVLNAVTSSIYAPGLVIVSGTVVKYE